MKEIFAHVLEFTLTFDKIKKKYQYFNVQNLKFGQNNTLFNSYVHFLYTRQLQPPRDDCAIRVQYSGSLA